MTASEIQELKDEVLYSLTAGAGGANYRQTFAEISLRERLQRLADAGVSIAELRALVGGEADYLFGPLTVSAMNPAVVSEVPQANGDIVTTYANGAVSINRPGGWMEDDPGPQITTQPPVQTVNGVPIVTSIAGQQQPSLLPLLIIGGIAAYFFFSD